MASLVSLVDVPVLVIRRLHRSKACEAPPTVASESFLRLINLVVQQSLSGDFGSRIIQFGVQLKESFLRFWGPAEPCVSEPMVQQRCDHWPTESLPGLVRY